MGLDIYSGQLTRYYSRDWETIVQQQSKERGIQCSLTDANGNEIKAVEDKTEIDQIRERITEWADNLASKLNPPLPTPLWDETSECDYYTDKPDWQAFGALVLLQACQSLNRPLPEFSDNKWEAFDNPIIKEAKDMEIANSLLFGVTLWLPLPNKALFETVYPTGDKGPIASIKLLRHELEELNRQLWNADETTILSWRNEKYYIPYYDPEKQTERKRLFGFIPWKKKKPKEIFRTEELAQCAFSILYMAVLFAEEHQVPILLDF